MDKHGARILISNNSLLRWIKLEGGRIHYIGADPNRLNTLSIVIEHPDLPIVKEGEEVPLEWINYQRISGVWRINPMSRNIFKRLRYYTLYYLYRLLGGI